MRAFTPDRTIIRRCAGIGAAARTATAGSPWRAIPIVNDRFFEVMPNYGTVENAKNLPHISSGQKFRLATAGVFDWGAYPFNAALSGIAQAKNDPKEWGQGWGAYGKRFGASFADNSIGTYMTTAIFPSLLHEDPRYYQLGK